MRPNFIADIDNIEEVIEDGEKQYYIEVFAYDGGIGFPHEMEVDRYMWDFTGNGFLSGDELNKFGAKATYKLRLKKKEEEKGFTL